VHSALDSTRPCAITFSLCEACLLRSELTFVSALSAGRFEAWLRALCRFASEMQSWWREQQEQQPVQFMETQALPALKVWSRRSITTWP
jgi:hypothetical protein